MLRAIEVFEPVVESRKLEGLRGGQHASRRREGGTHRPRVRVALGRIRLAGAGDDRGERAEHLRSRDRSVRTRRERPDRRVTDDRHLPGARLHEDHRERVQVGATVERPAGLLRRRIARGADEAAGRLRPRRLGQRTGEPEVGDAHDPVRVEEQVRRLDVAVHDPAPVRIRQRGSNLPADVRGLLGREVIAHVEQAAQRSTLQQLDDHERDAVVLAPVVDGHHVRVVECGGHLGLGPEAPLEPAVVAERVVEHLDRDSASQPHVVGQVDARTRPRADGREQPVPAVEDATDEVDEGGVDHGVRIQGRRR